MVMHSTHSHNTFLTNLFLVHFNKQEFRELASGRYNNFWLVVAALSIAVSFSNPFRTIPKYTSLRSTQTHTVATFCSTLWMLRSELNETQFWTNITFQFSLFSSAVSLPFLSLFLFLNQKFPRQIFAFESHATKTIGLFQNSTIIVLYMCMSKLCVHVYHILEANKQLFTCFHLFVCLCMHVQMYIYCMRNRRIYFIVCLNAIQMRCHSKYALHQNKHLIFRVYLQRMNLFEFHFLSMLYSSLCLEGILSVKIFWKMNVILTEDIWVDCKFMNFEWWWWCSRKRQFLDIYDRNTSKLQSNKQLFRDVVASGGINLIASQTYL